MEKKSVKILSAKQISIQNPLTEEWMENPLSYSEDHVRAVDPDFKQFISAGDARRMGKLLKRALILLWARLSRRLALNRRT